MREIGFTSKVFSPSSIVGQLSGGERQGVAIARAIYKNADLIVLDEPTTALSLTETAKVFHFVRQVRASGRSILFIGHNIHHVYDIADRFVVLDRGKRGAGSGQGQSAFGRNPHQVHGRGRASGRRPDRALPRNRSRMMSETDLQATATSPDPDRRKADLPLYRFVSANRAWLGTLAVFVVMMAIFITANPRVFLDWGIYRSVMITLPVALFVVVPLVFVVTVGEIDLSFPATMGFSAWTFALLVQAGYSPYLGVLAALATGMVLGAFVGVLVVYFSLSSLIATLGMNFMLRGVIQIVMEGKSIALMSLTDSSARTVFSRDLWGVPVQMFWATGLRDLRDLPLQPAPLRRAGEDRRRQSRQRGADGHRYPPGPGDDLRLRRLRRRLRRVLLDDDQLHLVADHAATATCCRASPRSSSAARRPGAASARWRAGAIGAVIVSFIQTGVVGAGLSGLLRPVLQRPDHRPVADRPPLEPVQIPLGRVLSVVR